MSGLAFGFPGELIADVERWGKTVDVNVTWDEHQVSLRQALGIGPVLDRAVLRALSTLPEGHVVSWETIDPVMRVFLDAVPEGLVLRTRRGVERVYRPPLIVMGVTKKSDRWIGAAEAVSLVGRGAPRGVVLERSRAARTTSDHAKRLGIGLALQVDSRDSPEVVVPPQRRHVRLDDLTWLIAELTYGKARTYRSDSAQAFS